VSGFEFDLALHQFAGARAHRAVHTGVMDLPAHKHDWPCLAFHLLGAYDEINESGRRRIDGPAVAFHAAGAHHAERFDEAGAEVLIVTFDPAWLRLDGLDAGRLRTRCWTEGEAAGRASLIAALWLDRETGEHRLRQETASFLARAAAAGASSRRPRWFEDVRHALRADPSRGAPQIAAKLGLNRAWLARAYRAVAGEGLRDAARRYRTERAVRLLRSSALSIAEVAAQAGFCDQSHLNRALKALTGRTPVQIRGEAAARGLD